jgi:hypothetical protein
MSNSQFSIRPVTAGNAAHVAGVFRALYGDDFPIGYVYDADLLLAELAGGRLCAALACDGNSRAVGYISCYRCAPNAKLWEVGNLLVVPEYSASSLALALTDYFLQPGNLARESNEGIVDEAVCHHYFTQVACAKVGMVDCALALDQLDGASFKQHRPETARVACLLQFLEYAEASVRCHLPRCYGDILRRVLEPLAPRRLLTAEAPLPSSGATLASDDWWAAAGTWRVSVSRVGSDWADYLDRLLDAARERRAVSLLVVLNADQACIDAAVDALRQRGFFLGGLFPRWFGADGIMLQKLSGAAPDFAGIKLYGRTAKDLRDAIAADWKSTGARDTLR